MDSGVEWIGAVVVGGSYIGNNGSIVVSGCNGVVLHRVCPVYVYRYVPFFWYMLTRTHPSSKPAPRRTATGQAVTVR